MKRALGISLLFSLMAPCMVQAQDPPGLTQGDRIRVTAPECQLRKDTGTLISFDRGLFAATLHGRAVECPSEALTRLEVSVREKEWWKASLLGMGIGAGVGIILGLVEESKYPEGNENEGLALMLFTMAGTGIGLVVGTIWGVARGKDTWERVPLPPSQPVFRYSPDGRFGIGFSITMRR